MIGRKRDPENPEMRATSLPQLSLDTLVTAVSAVSINRSLFGERRQDDVPPTADERQSQYAALRRRVSAWLVPEVSGRTDVDDEITRHRIAELVTQASQELGWPVELDETITAIRDLYDDLMGLGPIDRLMRDSTITEIMVNGTEEIWIERKGILENTGERFHDENELMRVIDRIVSRAGRRVDESSPMVTARLADGSRVNVVIPPVAVSGPAMTIRRFLNTGLEVDDLIAKGTASRAMFDFMSACVRTRQNIFIMGGTGSGKTTVLNVLSAFIPEGERVVTIEDAAELKLRQRHVITLEARPANIEGKGQVTIRDLVKNALHMRPDRIVVGECRGGEALDMLQAMNTGHEGSMTTLHANNAEEIVPRLEAMVMMAETEMSGSATRAQIGSAMNYVVQTGRLKDGTRRVLAISEVERTREGNIRMHDVFRFNQHGVDDHGQVIGEHTATGYVPKRLDIMASRGVHVNPSLFQSLSVAVTGDVELTAHSVEGKRGGRSEMRDAIKLVIKETS